MEYQKLLDLIKREVKPALGCTEPVAIALAVATVRSYIREPILSLDLEVSANLIKNAAGVRIPNTNEMGLKMAAALGAVAGDPNKGMEVLEGLTELDIEKARDLICSNRIHIKKSEQNASLLIIAKICSAGETAEVMICDSHTNIVKLEVNGEVLVNIPANKNESILFPELSGYCMDDLITTCEAIPINELDFLREGITMNMQMANIGLQECGELGIGSRLSRMVNEGLLSDDITTRIRINVSAACDARMAGVGHPVMSTMGSGNHGIIAIIPVAMYGEYIHASEGTILRALAISHIITAYVKCHTGKLSPICGCAVAAGVGAAAATTYLMGGSRAVIYGAIENVIGNLSGMVCDGAKGGCALKLSTSSAEIIMAAQLAVAGSVIDPHDGIIGENIDETIRNLGQFCNVGMKNADETLLDIMLKKEKRQ